MKVSIEEAGVCEKKIVIEFDESDVQKAYDSTFALFSKQASIKGFRPGKAPREMVVRRYGADILKYAREDLEAKGFSQCLRENPMDVVAERDVERTGFASPSDPYTVSLVVSVSPSVPVPDYKGLPLEARKIAVTDEAVQDTVQRLRKDRGEFKDAPDGTPAQAGDLVQIDYTATSGGKPLSDFGPKAQTLAEHKDFWVMTDEEYSFLPGFGPQLVGLKSGDSKTVEITFPADAAVEELRSLPASFAVTVKKVRAHAPAEMDDKFFAAFQVKDETALRSTIRSSLERAAQRDERARVRDAAMEALLAKAGPVECSAAETERETNRLVYDLAAQNLRNGVSEKDLRDQLPRITEEARKAAGRSLSVKHLLDAVAKAEDITVSDSAVDMEERIQAYASGASSVKALAKASGVSQETLRERVRERIRQRLAIDAVLREAAWTGDGAEDAKAQYAPAPAAAPEAAAPAKPAPEA